MNSAHQAIDFRQHPKRTVWLHRTEWQDTDIQPVDAIREDFMEPDDAVFDEQAGHPLTLEELQYIGSVMCFGLCVLVAALGFAVYALWPMLRALW